MELYLTSVFILLNIVGLNGQIRNVNSNLGQQQQQPQQITAAANFAVNNLNAQSRRRGGRRWYTLTNIQNSNTQSMPSLVHTIDMILTESMCLNTNNYQGATQAQCPPYNGGAVMRCSVSVLQQPMSFNFRLQNSNCSPLNPTSNPTSNPTGTAQTGNTVNNQPVQSTGSTNSPQGLTDAANFATNQLNSQNRQQAPNRRWYTLVDIRNPRQQTTNAMIYNMDILLSESSCPNTIAYINASPARCPPASGSNSQLCSVVVSYTPTRVGYRLTNYNCQREQQQQQQPNVQGTNPVSQPTFTTSGSIGTNTNTGSSSTTNINIPNIRGDIGLNQPQFPSNQVTTQIGQPNPRPIVNQNGLQQPIIVGPQTGTGAGAMSNIPVNPGLPTNTGSTNPDGSINFNPGNSGPRGQTPSISSGVNNIRQLSGIGGNGPLNRGSSVNLNTGGFGSRIPSNGATNGFGSGVPQAIRPPTITVNNIRPFRPNVAANPGTSINPTSFGSGVPQVNPRGVNSGVGGFVQTSGPGQMAVQGQQRPVSLTGPQTQIMSRGQQINNAGQSTGDNVPVQQSNQIDPQVSTAAIFATNTYNAQMRQQFSSDDKWYSLVNINNVRRQGNGGSVINMDITLQQTSCLNTAASTGATINHCPPISGGRVRICSVSVVYASMGQGFRLLGSNCRDAQPQQRAAGSPQSVMSFPTPQQGSVGAQPITGASSSNTNNQQNEQIRKAANTATNKINDRSRTNSPNDNQWYILTEIQDPQIQNVGGSLIDMNLILSQSTCLNVAAYVDASSSKCPVSPGGLTKVCSVKLWHESFNVEDKLLSFSCQQPETSVIQGPTGLQQGQQQSVAISGVQQPRTAASVITGAVLQDPVVAAPLQATNTNVLIPGNSLNTGSQSGTGISPGAGTSTGSSTSNAAITLAGVNTNTEMLPNGMANIASTAQGSSFNQGPNTNSATAPLGMNTNPANAPLDMNTNPANAPLGLKTNSATAPLGINTNPATAPLGMNTNPANAPLGMNTNPANAPLGMNTNPATAPLGMNAQANNQGTVSTGLNAVSTQGSPRVIDVANFATNEINTRNRQTEQSWFTLVDLTNATRQELASGGWIYQMEIIISESICQNTEANFNTNNMQCPERNGGRVQQCLIEVTNQPNATNLQMDRLECMLDPQSQTGPSNMPPGVLQQPLPNSPQQQQQVPAPTVTTTQVTPEIMDAARFAAQEINMQIRQDPNLIDPKWFTLADVKYPQQKFLGGMVYSMEIDLVESTCLNIDQNINANTTQCPPQNKASTKTCYIEVERVPVLLTYKLAIQHCSTHGFSNNASLFTKAQTQPVANQTQEITAAANFAANKINEQNRKPNTNRFVLVDIHNPQEKSFSGWEYRMNLMLQQSDCPNTPAYNDATVQQCPPQTGGPLRLCEVRVFHQPWTFGYRLEDAQCLNQ